ncbi:MAG: methyltransferase domain-containing protein [Luteitalea sp.]|nr:methyltransferase domain-containing protein [Luteitalea sp.]
MIRIPGRRPRAGWEGWDEYAPFYDWENARTVGRRDVRFWRDLAGRVGGPVLELGCGTGRVALPLARACVSLVGIDRSEAMLAGARRRLRRAATRALLVRGDITSLPFEPATFPLVIAPYGILQSLLSDRQLACALASVARVVRPDGLFGVDLVADVPRWQEYQHRITLRGRRGPRGLPVALVESVRQDPRRKLTIFDQEYIEGSGRARHATRFSVAFRTLSVPAMTKRLERAGFQIDALLGDYNGRPWDPRADTWLILARRDGDKVTR